MKTLFILPFLINSFNGFSQYFEDQKIEDTTLISSWIVNNVADYEGVYFYGFSEYSTTSYLAIHNGIIDFQISNAGREIYNSDGEFEGWEWNIQNYTNVKIVGNKFYSDQSNGEFVVYNYEGKEHKCLRLDQPPKDVYHGEPELGILSDKPKTEYLHGKHAHLKFDILEKKTLRKYNLKELKIMRNEIFARYGYKFKVGGEMDTYFSKQNWYSATKEDVTMYLTNIEKKNIENILKIEAELKP